MPYTLSRARKQFDLEIRTILSTVRIAHSRQCISMPVREFALCSGILLGSARLETYLEDLILDWVMSIRRGNITTERLPKTIRAYLLFQSSLKDAYTNYLADGDEGALLNHLEGSLGQTHYEFALDGRSLPTFAPQTLYANRKYPSPHNLKRLFRRFGKKKVFDDLNRIGRRDIQAMLVSFNDIRTAMAHSGRPPGLAKDDIIEHIDNIRVVVSCLDKLFYELVCSTVGQSCWVR